MSKSLSPEAIEALRRLNEVGIGQQPPLVSMAVAAELLGAGLAGENTDGAIEITCDGRKYLSGDCD
ncbi:hypothetical protein WKR88_06305 [Trinickia caryophylli]|uniref:Uncharacterized protein n=1 Tax=Trinickia caryophylli TaxID=28094 RepID=A0A1X7FXE3_TRICW|nr:hypothetical protein [Trinickia caryophylli]PMS11795.1 hypothetical protein C0Z17_13320 [Trinickia caryophylli]TRX17478.1 hypothetical protein FNF07_04000 [Trinickia caryophylli]WQE11777.1 hypothetical protein U0034_18905 [Trinickia caryophylli]SMF59747.1 hypothetical protein SAMN06295900_11230 [Trinickia caryophylli]GLU34723.1 hypothetical protein Busp01_45650 [Trinickia caryophylli]